MSRTKCMWSCARSYQDKNCLVKGIVGTLYMYVVKKLVIVDLLFAVTGTCILQSLHEYLNILLTFKVLNWMCPDYLKNILSVCNNKRYNLRSSDAIFRKPSSFKETCTTVGTCYNNNLQRIRKQKGCTVPVSMYCNKNYSEFAERISFWVW